MSVHVPIEQTVTTVDRDGVATDVKIKKGKVERTDDNAAALDFLISAGLVTDADAVTPAPDAPAPDDQPEG